MYDNYHVARNLELVSASMFTSLWEALVGPPTIYVT